MDVEPKACPFCGEIKPHAVNLCGNPVDVVCGTCGATAPWTSWNRRVNGEALSLAAHAVTAALADALREENVALRARLASLAPLVEAARAYTVALAGFTDFGEWEDYERKRTALCDSETRLFRAVRSLEVSP